MDASLTYSYIKARKDFGKQTRFCETPAVMLDSINPDKSEQRLYCLRNPVKTESQTTISFSERYINTKRVVLRDQGVNHAEGGWPKEINFNDEESTNRYRRRFERDDMYVNAILSSNDKFEHLIKQNNAIEMYNMYFKEMNPQEPVEKYFSRKTNVYVDPDKRPIASIGWTYEDDSKIVVAYCNKKYPIAGPLNKNTSCLIWDVENSNEALADLITPSACWQIACCPTNSRMIIGGLQDGRVCIFDIRVKKQPIEFSPMHLAHRDPVASLLFLQSRLNNEFFSGSSDGQCMWWDVRNLSEPTDLLVISIDTPTSNILNLAKAEAISALQFDRSFPTKFLCGTDTGLVINVNRKGKTHKDVMSAIFVAHNGPVKAVQRNPSLSKMFITCGDWSSHIWSDDIHSSPIIFGAPHPSQVSDVFWSPQRVSSFMSVCYDGKFRYWDLLRKYHEPVVTIPISKNHLLRVMPNEEGRFIAVGDEKGSLSLISLSDNMVYSGNRDKQLMIQHFDREARREHILETRIKEIRLKLKAEKGINDYVSGAADEESLIKAAENEYRRIVVDEIKRIGTSQYSRGKNDKMRKR